MLRGDVVEMRAPRVLRGREQQGRRYGVVLQNSDLLALSTVIVAPTSTRAHEASFRPTIELLGERTRLLVEQLGAVDHSRLGELVRQLSWREMQDVDRALSVVVGLRT